MVAGLLGCWVDGLMELISSYWLVFSYKIRHLIALAEARHLRQSSGSSGGRKNQAILSYWFAVAQEIRALADTTVESLQIALSPRCGQRS